MGVIRSTVSGVFRLINLPEGRSISTLIYLYIFIPLFTSFYVIYKRKPSLLFNYSIFWCLSLSGYFVCDLMIPKFKRLAIKCSLFGMDINKRGTEAGKIKM